VPLNSNGKCEHSHDFMGNYDADSLYLPLIEGASIADLHAQACIARPGRMVRFDRPLYAVRVGARVRVVCVFRMFVPGACWWWLCRKYDDKSGCLWERDYGWCHCEELHIDHISLLVNVSLARQNCLTSFNWRSHFLHITRWLLLLLPQHRTIMC
jgi:hypothetical protein